MRRFRSLGEHLAFITVILIAASIWTGLRAGDDKETKHKCPLCGSEDVSFANTPEGAFARMRFAMATRDTDLLTSIVVGIGDEALADLKKRGGKGGLLMVLACDLKSCKVDGDRAALTLTDPDDKEQVVQAVKIDGVWKIDMRAAHDKPKYSECHRNLSQLGTYIMMYVGRFGSDRDYPGPGIRLLTSLYNVPNRRISIASGQENLLLCKESGETNTPESIGKDDPGCTSYECIEGMIGASTDRNTPIVWDKRPVHDGKRTVLRLSGGVEEMTEEQFQAERKKYSGK